MSEYIHTCMYTQTRKQTHTLSMYMLMHAWELVSFKGWANRSQATYLLFNLHDTAWGGGGN